MKERPILFSAPMVRAILEGRKTQTRRVMKPQPDGGIQFGAIATPHGVVNGKGNPLVCKYGQPGDRLWVRETWMPDPSCDDDAWDDAAISYMEWDGCGMPMRNYPDALKSVSNVIHRAGWDGDDMVGWRPSIHMPRWASRITLEIVSVRVEKLTEISDQDVVAEGIECTPTEGRYNCAGDKYVMPYRNKFMALWESINGPGSWQKNPWVWCIEFKRVSQ